MSETSKTASGVVRARYFRLKTPQRDEVIEQCDVLLAPKELSLWLKRPIPGGTLVSFELHIDDTPLIEGVGRVARRRGEEDEEESGEPVNIVITLFKIEPKSRELLAQLAEEAPSPPEGGEGGVAATGGPKDGDSPPPDSSDEEDEDDAVGDEAGSEEDEDDAVGDEADSEEDEDDSVGGEDDSVDDEDDSVEDDDSEEDEDHSVDDRDLPPGRGDQRRPETGGGDGGPSAPAGEGTGASAPSGAGEPTASPSDERETDPPVHAGEGEQEKEVDPSMVTPVEARETEPPPEGEVWEPRKAPPHIKSSYHTPPGVVPAPAEEGSWSARGDLVPPAPSATRITPLEEGGGADAQAATAFEAILTLDARGHVLSWSPAAADLFGYGLGEIVGQSATLLLTEESGAELLGALSLHGATSSKKSCGGSLPVTGLRRDGKELVAALGMCPWSALGRSFWSVLIRPDLGADDQAEAEHLADELPSLLDGKYRLGNEIGRGRMGAVYRGVDTTLERPVAIKFLLPTHHSRADQVERFRREAQAMAAVRHYNVLHIYAFGQLKGRDYFVMEYLDGRTAGQLLDDARARRAPLLVSDVLWIIDQACTGLATVHRSGAIHRDIKPANLMVQSRPPRVVLMDFGIAPEYRGRDAKRTPEPLGTPVYMAPEVIMGRPMHSEQEQLSDIYALGVTFFELLTGELPFAGGNWVEVLQRHLTQPPPPVTSFRDDLPPGLSDLVAACMAKEPKDRFQSCDELRDAIQPIAYAAASPSTPPPGTPPDWGDSQAGSPRPGRIAASPESGATTTSATSRVVLANADPEFREFVRDCAREAIPESRFWVAKDSLAALNMARARPPRVLLAAVDDPALNGVELAATLISEQELSRVKLILVADKVEPGDLALFDSMGVAEVLIRPVSREALVSALSRASSSETPPP